MAFRYEPYSVARPTAPLCLGLMVQLLGGGVINQTSLDVVLMLLSPVAHCEASWKRSQIKTRRTRLPTAPAPTRGLIRLLSSLNIPVSHKKCQGGGEEIVQMHARFAVHVCRSIFRRHGRRRRRRTTGLVNAGGVGRQTKADN